jgi:hypothetical protein
MNRFRILAILFILATAFGGNPRTAYAICMDGDGSCPGSQVCYQNHCRTCVLPGGTDDVLYATNCCSGAAVPGSTYCLNPADYGTTWASCYQTCA